MLLQESSSEENTNVINYNIIKLLGGSNKNIPALSKFVQLKYSESMGRCLIVSTDVSPGKVIMFILLLMYLFFSFHFYFKKSCYNIHN